MNEENKLLEVAMEIILHAGDARNLEKKSLEYAQNFDFDKANSKLDEARREIVLAHKAQTNIVQSEMSGEKYEHSLLFNHAQDTLMTVMSELNIAKSLTDFAKVLNDKIDKEVKK